MLKTSDLKPAQRKGVSVLVKRRQCCLFSSPGDGKTIITLTSIALLKKKYNTAKKVLIVAPPEVCKAKVWPLEVANWKHTKFMAIETLHGLPPDKRKERLFKQDSDLYVISYNNLQWLMKTLRSRKKKLADLFDAVIFDELSMLKNPSSKRFKGIRNQILDVPIKYGLTASPLGNSYESLWSEVHCCITPSPLGRTMGDYRDRYFTLVDRDIHLYKIKPDAAEKITKRIKRHAFYIKNARGTAYEDRVSVKKLSNIIPANLMPMYEELKREHMTYIGNDAITSANAAVTTNKLRQMEAGAIYKNPEFGDEYEGPAEWIELNTHRIDATKRLVDCLQGQQLLIFYAYQHELIRLQRAFPSGISIKSDDAINRWNGCDIQIMFAHPASAGHGLNLHLGGAYNMLHFNTPWSYERYEQTIGRLDRTGQKKVVNVNLFAGTYIADRALSNVEKNASNQDIFKNSVALKL